MVAVNQSGGGRVGNRWGGDGVLAWAVLSLVDEVGLERVTVEAIAGRMDRSRATLFREYGSLGAMLAVAYDEQVRRFAALVSGLHVGSPREQVVDVFERLRAALRTREGVAFRAVRATIATRSDPDDFRRREVEGLDAVRSWLGSLIDHAPERPGLVTALTAAFWSLCLGCAPDPGPSTQAELDLACDLLSPFLAHVADQPPPDDTPDLVDLTALGDLL
jgi:AcrR family transcriptional regulator